MNIVKKILLPLVCGLALVACVGHGDVEVLAKLQTIQELGRQEETAKIALARLDSLEEVIDDASRYVRMKSRLLKARLQYVADVKPESDKEIKRLVEYFAAHGSAREQQEVYYASGCVYYELMDAPRAIEQFRRSEYIAEHAVEERDSTLLRLTYSCLSYLYGHITDFWSCLEYSKKEYDISRKLGKMSPVTIEHLAHAYRFCDSTEMANKYFDILLDNQRQASMRSFSVLSSALYVYVMNGQEGHADICAEMMQDMLDKKEAEPYSQSLCSLGAYYQLKGNVDSAMVFYEKVLAEKTNMIDMYNASKALYEICVQRGELKRAVDYAGEFVAINDSLALGRRQEEAAMVTNWYQYMQDKEEALRLEQENEEYRQKQLLWWVSSLSSLLVLLAVFLLYRARQKYKLAMQMETIKTIGQERADVVAQLKEKSASDECVKAGILSLTELLREKELRLAETKQENEALQEQLRRLEAKKK